MDASRRQRILALALPIIGGMVSQNLLNVVDTAMVGFLGNAALAAVGLGSFVVFMCQALILGISTGVQTLAARKKGEGRIERAANVLNTALLLVLVVAPVLSLILIQLPLSDLFIVYTKGDSRETSVEDFQDLFSDSWNMPLGDQLIVKLRYRLGS